jgi:hypothetical protein
VGRRVKITRSIVRRLRRFTRYWAWKHPNDPPMRLQRAARITICLGLANFESGYSVEFWAKEEERRRG